MNLKEYLTPGYVKKNATTARKALNLSIRHWKQNSELTFKQFTKLAKKMLV